MKHSAQAIKAYPKQDIDLVGFADLLKGRRMAQGGARELAAVNIGELQIKRERNLIWNVVVVKKRCW